MRLAAFECSEVVMRDLSGEIHGVATLSRLLKQAVNETDEDEHNDLMILTAPCLQVSGMERANESLVDELKRRLGVTSAAPMVQSSQMFQNGVPSYAATASQQQPQPAASIPQGYEALMRQLQVCLALSSCIYSNMRSYQVILYDEELKMKEELRSYSHTWLIKFSKVNFSGYYASVLCQQT